LNKDKNFIENRIKVIKKRKNLIIKKSSKEVLSSNSTFSEFICDTDSKIEDYSDSDTESDCDTSSNDKYSEQKI